MTLSLICEGHCNPLLSAVDAELRQHPKWSDMPVGNEGLWSLQRRLLHTPHVRWTRRMHVQCEVCGSIRQFGDEGF